MEIDFGGWDDERTEQSVQDKCRELVAPFLDHMVTNFDTRIPANRTVDLLKVIFDCRRYPLGDHAASFDPLAAWGHDAALELIPRKFPGMDVSEFLIEYDRVKNWVRDHRDEFTQTTDAVTDKEGRVTRQASSKLLLTGPGGIFPALHERTDVVSTLPMTNFMDALSPQNIETETYISPPRPIPE